MTPIDAYRISSIYNAAENADENDTRNKRESKRKLVNESQRMLQAEHKIIPEKLLADAMQLVSYKSKSKSNLTINAQILSRKALELFHIESDLLQTEIFQSGIVQPDIVQPDIVQPDIAFNLAAKDAEERSPQFADFPKKLFEIESSLAGSQRRAENIDLLFGLKKFSMQLSDKEVISAMLVKHQAETKLKDPNSDRDSMKCSLDFIEGYCEASSFNDDLKKEVSDELNIINDLLDQIAALNVPVGIPEAIIEARAVQIMRESNIKSTESNSSLSRNKFSVLDKNEEKKRGDTLPLTTLRSI